MVETVDFWDKTAEKYSKSPIRDEETYREKLEITQRYLNEESRVFEFGCGTGTTAIAHAPHAGSIVATDISSKMIEIASSKAAAAGIENIEFRCETIEESSAEAESFDMVMAHNILHLLEDPKAATEFAYRILKPGGVFVSSTACLGDGLYHWRVLIFLGRLFGKVPFVNVMKRATLESYFKETGFEEELAWKRRKAAAFIILKKPSA